MIAWKPRPFIFVHIPKCAGTSMEAALIPLATPGGRIEDLSEADRDRHWLPGQRERQHRKLLEYAAEFPLADYFKFAMVRNPWERTVSQIEFLLKGKSGKKVFIGSTAKENIEIYCNSIQRPGNQDLGACQLDYLMDGTGGVGVDFIGRFENLTKDFNQICAKLGLPQPLALPHFKNAERPEHYSEFFDDESAEWVRRRFARDIEYFGYTFERRAPLANPTMGRP